MNGPDRAEPDRNTPWARAFVEEMVRAGVRDVCIVPGSRSGPLVLACARMGALRLRVHLDERSAGFFALGVGRATGVPAAVITTSGTAAANLFPAVVEASLSETPLLVLTADRPHRLRDADANQAIDQLRLYGPYVREFFEVAPPSTEGSALRHLRTVASRAVAGANGLPAGPVHLNFPFDLPLEPAAPAGDTPTRGGRATTDALDDEPRAVRGRPDDRPYVVVSRRRPLLAEEELESLRQRLATSRRPLLVAGPAPEALAVGRAVARFAAALGVPVLADALSGARFRALDGACVYGGYHLFLQETDVRAALVPDLVMRVGRTPISAVLSEYLEGLSADAHVVIDPSHRWKDHVAVATHVLRGDAADALERLATSGAARPDPAWCALWTRLERAVEDALAEPLAAVGPEHRFEGMVARQVVGAVPVDGTLFVSSSMPVRDVDAFGGTRAEPIRVLGNRGASGIDGIVSTALGVAAGAGRPVVALIGDIALLHDANGLLAAREPDVRAVIVVVNNDGGGIFHFLPVRDHEPHFTRLFATPHGVEPERLAALYGVPWERVEPAALADRVRGALAAGGVRMIEIRTDREVNRDRREAATMRARAAAAAALESR